MTKELFLIRYSDGEFVVDSFSDEDNRRPQLRTTKFEEALNELVISAIKLMGPEDATMHVQVETLGVENVELGGSTVRIPERVVDGTLEEGRYILEDGADFLTLKRGAVAIINGHVTHLTMEDGSEAHVAGAIEFVSMGVTCILSTPWSIQMLIRDEASLVSCQNIVMEKVV